MTDNTRQYVLGVYFAKGVAYLALVDVDGREVRLEPAKIEASESERAPISLKNFLEAFRSEIRSRAVSLVGVAHPLKYNNWAYTDAFRRASLETAIMLAVDAEGIAFRSVELYDALQACEITQPPKKPPPQKGKIPLPAHVAACLKTQHSVTAADPQWAERSVALLVARALRTGRLKKGAQS